jgi:ABC-type polysaccharide/polyol phosphate export permease
MKQHENYKELIWVLAKTDFKLRYQNSALGYVWALLQPLLLFGVLNFVFSSVFNRGGSIKYYTLQLLVSIILYTFFSEGTNAGMASLVSKSQLVTKIYVPRWTIIVASTLNSAMIFVMNLVVIAFFFALKGFMPSPISIFMFFVFSLAVYAIVLEFSLLTAPLYARFRDLLMIWSVITRALFYATPIIYPLSTIPEKYHKILLLNPMAYIIHFNKEALINNHFPDIWQTLIFIATIVVFFAIGIFAYKKLIPKVAEEM